MANRSSEQRSKHEKRKNNSRESKDSPLQLTASFYKREDESISKRTIKKDVSDHLKAVATIEEHLTQLKQLRRDNSNTEKIDFLKASITAHFVTLKTVNRTSKTRLNDARNRTEESKKLADEKYLDLQNLQYELGHFKKEIDKCLQFKSDDGDIDLVDVEQFYSEAPPRLANEATKTDEHKQKLFRLEYELEQRKSLADEYKTLCDERDNIVSIADGQRNKLEALKPKLECLLESSQPLQDYLEIPIDKTKDLHSKANLLSRPLYTLFLQLDSYAKACDHSVTVDIVGDISEAMLERNGLPDNFDSDSGQEDDVDKEEVVKKKRRGKHAVQKITTDVKKQKVLHCYPLHIKLNIQLPKANDTFQLTFRYLTVLKLITVHVSIPSLTNIPEVKSYEDILNTNTLFSCLYKDDTGEYVPDSITKQLLSKNGVKDMDDCFENIGKPYIWAQKISGLQILTESQSCLEIDPSIQDTIKRIRDRVIYRLSLRKQISDLENLATLKKLNPPVKLEFSEEWKKISEEDVREECGETSKMFGILCNPTYLKCKANLSNYKIELILGLACDFPSTTSLWRVQIENNNKIFNCCNNAALRTIEYTTNSIPTDPNLIINEQFHLLLQSIQVWCVSNHQDETEQSIADINCVAQRFTRGKSRDTPMYFNRKGFYVHDLNN
ncbi:DgyrCDS7528 [Dimorphilus gyrociliatus]|uniref:DgyrCDS7528 n=1 Tax=Dimorphilus gyrociliatus TaxID=2664684 RepID=A0A7I8VRA7_9ANNE|nr:DgyrCDS7528 [Dimorphilus gyrociliatus]